VDQAVLQIAVSAQVAAKTLIFEHLEQNVGARVVVPASRERFVGHLAEPVEFRVHPLLVDVIDDLGRQQQRDFDQVDLGVPAPQALGLLAKALTDGAGDHSR